MSASTDTRLDGPAGEYFQTGDNQFEPGSIFLMDAKFPHNVGIVLRTAACFCVPKVVVTGERILDAVNALDRVPREERLRAYKDVKLCWMPTSDVRKFLSQGKVVCVEFMKNAVPIETFRHPKDGVYVFGPEDGTVPASVRSISHSFVKIDSLECLNLAQAVSIALYDRQFKDVYLSQYSQRSLAEV